MVKNILEMKGFMDECWIVPCGKRPDKPSLKTTGEHRLEIIAKALENYPAFKDNEALRKQVKVDDIEIKIVKKGDLGDG